MLMSKAMKVELNATPKLTVTPTMSPATAPVSLAQGRAYAAHRADESYGGYGPDDVTDHGELRVQTISLRVADFPDGRCHILYVGGGAETLQRRQQGPGATGPPVLHPPGPARAGRIAGCPQAGCWCPGATSNRGCRNKRLSRKAILVFRPMMARAQKARMKQASCSKSLTTMENGSFHLIDLASLLLRPLLRQQGVRVGPDESDIDGMHHDDRDDQREQLVEKI